MADERKGWPVTAALYLKRWLEGNFYDKIFETEIGEKLKTLDQTTKYGIELGLNLLTAFFDQQLAGDTALKRLVKEIGLDASSEFNKRLINGTKERLMSNAKSNEQKQLVSILLGLEDQTLIDLLNWLYDMDETQRKEVLDQFSRLSPDELMKLAKLSPDNRKRLFELFRPQEQQEGKEVEKQSGLSKKVLVDLNAATLRLNEFRKKLREKRQEKK